ERIRLHHEVKSLFASDHIIQIEQKLKRFIAYSPCKSYTLPYENRIASALVFKLTRRIICCNGLAHVVGQQCFDQVVSFFSAHCTVGILGGIWFGNRRRTSEDEQQC